MVLMNVSEFDNVTDATDTLVSALQAFKDQSVDADTLSMKIIDVFNQIGNSYAISTSDLADSLTRSSASLVAANNTLEQSVALTTAANTTIQNPEVVGTTLKTLAMRIRGVKTELEEAGEDTEGMITNTAKLQEKVQALTNVDGSGGINILANNNEFKSTYDILLEISRVWDKMNDVDQAALLEIIAGKRAGSAVASILANGDILENAYKDALGADGSAQQELSTYLDSIQGKIDQFNNSTQTMWMNFMNSDVLKFFIELATGVVNVTDKIGLLNVAVAAFMAKTAFSADSFMQFFNADKIAQSVTDKLNTMAVSAGKAAANTTLVGTAATAASFGVKLLNSALTMGISLLAGLIINGVIKFIDKITTSSKEAAEAAEEAINTYQETQKTLREQKSTIEELASAYEKLSKGVDPNTNKNIRLSTSSYEEYLDVCNDIADICPSLVEGFDAQGNAILSCKGNVAELTQAYKDMIISANDAVLVEGKNIFETFKDSAKELKTSSSNNKELTYGAIQNLDKILHSQDLDAAIDKYASTGSTTMVQIMQALDDAGLEQNFGDWWNILDDESGHDFIKRAIQENRQIVQSIVSDFNAQVSSEVSKIQPLAEAYISNAFLDGDYTDLSFEAQDIINSIVSQFDFDFYNQFESLDDMYDYLSDMLSNFNKLSTNDLANITDSLSLRTQLQNNEITLKEYQDQMLSFVDTIKKSGLDEIAQEQILQMFDIDLDAENSIGKEIDQMIKYAQSLVSEFDDGKQNVLTLSYSDLQIINSPNFDEFRVNDNVFLSWEQLKASIKAARITMTEDFTSDNFSDYADSINSVSSNIATLQEALENLESGKFSITDYIELIEQFPDLAKGVDVSSKKFKGLAQNLKKAIRNSPDDLVEELELLRNQLIEAGKSTESIDQLINSIENLPVEAVRSLGEEYITLTDQINEAKQAQNELKEAMSENPNEGYETRGDAIEQMKTLMEKGLIGSESELWSIAEAFGFTYDSAKTINENADALYKFITAREAWYATDKDGNYTYDGTKNFLNDVEKVVAKNEELQKMGVKWNYNDKTGALDFDFNNASWDEIVNILGKSKELAGLTSEEFYDLLMQVGQFFDINWQDADDLIWFMNQLNTGTESVSENFESTKDAVRSFLESNDVSSDWLNLDLESAQKELGWQKVLSEETRAVLTEYYKLKQKFEEDPLGINMQLSKDSKKNLEEGLTDDSLNAINQLVSTAQDMDTGVTWLSLDELAEKAKEAGMNVDELDKYIQELKEAGKIIDLEVTEDDPLGLVAMQHDAETTISYLNALGVTAQGLDGAFTISLPSFVDMMVANGWGSDQISAYINTLNSQGYTFTYTTAENKTETLNVNTEEGQAKVDELVASSNQMTDTETLTVNLDGTAEGALKNMQTRLNSLTSKSYTVTVNEVTNKRTNYSWGFGSANGTAHAQGTAYKSGSWGAPKTTEALVGELGPELRVRGNEWTLIGENGAEFTDIRRGDIVFNHKQTEDLFKNGYITGRGRAYASGTGSYQKYTFSDTSGKEVKNASSKLSKAAKDISTASDKLSDDFKEIFDWIEVRIEEITDDLELKNAKLENTIGSKNQNAIIDDMIDLNQKLYDNLLAGASKYYEYASKLLEKVPEEHRKAAQDGSIAIESFTGKVGESALEAIENYREWIQKGDDLTQQAEETFTEISSLAKQAIDNIATDYDNQKAFVDNQIDLYNAYNSLLATDVGYESEQIYQAMIKKNNANVGTLQEQRNKMQAELNKRVGSGEIKKYSQDWYDAINDIAAVDIEIVELTTDIENFQDSINELHWDKFDDLMSRLEAVSDEADNLIDILGNKNVVDEIGNWTNEGITQLGLYAQQMEVAEMQAKEYEEQIKHLNTNWKKLGYTEKEYIEKLEELKSAQYDSIQVYHDAKDAIVDLNSERVEAIKKGIEKEIDAYSELIEKKKEALDAEQDLHDFKQTVMEQSKDIADIERKLAALAGDSSASARAKRAQLQAELLEAKASLEDTYYERSIENQQTALDKELETFTETKEKEMENWDKYLKNTEQVIADSLSTIQISTDVVYQTLTQMGEEYGLSITESLTTPWQAGETAIQSFSDKFGLAMSATVTELEKLELAFKETMLEIEQAGNKAVNKVDTSTDTYTSAEYKEPAKTDPPKQETSKQEQATQKAPPSVGSTVTVKKSATHWGSRSGNKKMASWVPGSTFTVGKVYGDGQVGIGKKKNGKFSYTGVINLTDLQGYAKGTTGVRKDQLALIDELGEELVIRPQNGRLTFLEKGTGVIPADLTSNLMSWGSIDPQDMLDRNRPSIGVNPSVINNTMEINVDASVGTLLSVENFNGDDPAEISKLINKALEQHTKNLNNSLKRFTR